MSDQNIKIKLSTPTLTIEDVIPLWAAVKLIAEHAPDTQEANAAIELMTVGELDSGRFDGVAWSIWFTTVRPTIH
jgi:hypothetical protein